ncbi:MAG: fibronectin type III domain-containing protein [Tepidisphaerales bacterium]
MQAGRRAARRVVERVAKSVAGRAERGLARVEQLEARRLLAVSVSAAVGGGFADAGLTAEYFANPTLSGSPAFTRRDVRVDFDWGTTRSPGGSRSPGFRDVGTDNYSVRWSGVVIPRFSETYTFKVIADDAVRLLIRPEPSGGGGGGGWTTLIDAFVLGQPLTTRTATFAMTAGQRYELRLEYAEGTGASTVRLRWSSPSTPEETIDPVIQTGLNNPDWRDGFVDLVMGARNTWEGVDGNPAPPMDANGWPMGNAAYVVQESLQQGLGVDPLMRGLVTFSFNGRATMGQFGNMTGLTWTYNPATNVTTGSFRLVDNNINATFLSFRNTDRDGDFGPDGQPDNDGITNLKLMRPVGVDAMTSYPLTGGPIFIPQFIDAARPFTILRHQLVANQQRDWSERTPPTYFNHNGGTFSEPKFGIGERSRNGPAWEYIIMLANETGTDLMLSVPVPASGETPADVNSYIYKLAQLLRYGSDQSGNVYTTDVPNPYHPPLNPNLRVYLELGNELWNFASVFFTDFGNLNKLVEQDVLANNANFAAINFDNLPTTQDSNGNYTSMPTWRLRKALHRTMQISDIFRAVWGNDALPGTSDEPRIRPIYEWQYGNFNGTASIPLTWAERYFNNGDGIARVPDPKPISWWLYGGGGATYYGSVNGNGLTDLNPNAGFDNVAVPVGYTVSPSGTGYIFTGNAGIARDGGSGDDIPTPFNGQQMGFLSGPGSEISFDVTFPTTFTSNVFAVAFKAHNRWTGTRADEQNLRILVDGVDITARTFSQGNGITPPVQFIPGLPSGTNAIPAWQARNVFWTNSEYYYSRTFTVTPGQTRRITIRGMGDITSPEPGRVHTAFIEDLRVTHVDRIFEDGMPGGGEATGQPAGTQIRESMNVQAHWANAYGLRYVAYEGGWSLGGDDGGSPLQLIAKYRDSRTADVQGIFMDYFHEANGVVNVHGTYAQWPSWADFFAEQGLINVQQYPIIQGMVGRANAPRPEPINGPSAPLVLRPVQATITSNANATTGQLNARGGWLNFPITVPATGTYELRLDSTGTSTLTLAVNGQFVATGASGSPLTVSVFLTRGQHSLRVINTGAAAASVTQLTVTRPGAPQAPVLLSALDGDGSAKLTWQAVPGAAGYVVRYGTASNTYTTRLDVGNVTTFSLTGLTNNQRYYFAISAYNASGDSLPSNERSVLPLADGQVAGIITWDFNGYVGGEASAPATSSTARLTVSPMTRGPGLQPNTSTFVNNTFSSWTRPTGRPWATTLAGALSEGQFNTFSVTTLPGQRVSLQSLNYNAYWQNPNNGTLRATGVSWSTDGGATWSAGVVATGGPATAGGSPYTVNLSGVPALQNFSGTVIFRIAIYGNTDANNNPLAGGAPFEWNGLGGPGVDVTVVGALFGQPPSAAPTGLTAVAPLARQVNLAWSDNSADETGFEIDRATDAAFSTGLVRFELPANATSFTDTTVQPGTTYFYRVRAVNGGGSTAPSNVASVTTPQVPAVPTGLAATAPLYNRVELSWAAAPPLTTSLRLERSAAGGPFTTLATLPATATTYVDPTTVGLTSYAYRLVAVGAFGESEPSAPVTVTTPQGPTPLAAETFTTTPVGPLLGTAGGVGWAGPWVNRDNNPALFTVAASPLMSYLNLDTGDKVVRFTGTSASAARTLAPAAFPQSTFDAQGNLTGGSTLWMSAVLRLDRATTDSVFVGLGSNTPAWFPTPTLQVGKIASSGWQLRLGSQTFQLGRGPTVGVANLIVLKIDFAARQLAVYINPETVGGFEPVKPTRVIPFSSLAFRSFVYFGGGQSGDSSLGAVRFGYRYLDVTPTRPDPVGGRAEPAGSRGSPAGRDGTASAGASAGAVLAASLPTAGGSAVANLSAAAAGTTTELGRLFSLRPVDGGARDWLGSDDLVR